MADIRDFIEALRDQAIGLRDAASAVGTGAVLAPIKGLYGLGKAAATGSLAEGANAIEDMHGAGEMPQTEEGRAYLEALGHAMTKGRELAAPVLDPYEEWATKHPALAAGGEAAAGLIPVGRVREAAVQGVKSAARAAAPLAREATLAASLRREAGPLSNAPRTPTVSAARVKKRPKTLREDIEEVVPPEGIPPELQGFGTSKAAREKRLADLTRRQQARGSEVATQKGGGTREKTEADTFRQSYNDLAQATGDPGLAAEAIQQAAEAGAHLKPTKGGGYVGAPGWVQTSRNLGAMRSDLDEQLAQGARAVKYADPERVGNWYDRAKGTHAEINEPWQLDRGLENTAVYSAGASPEVEGAFGIRDWNARQLGTGEISYRGPGARTLARAMRDDDKAKLAFKVGEYRGKNDPRVEEHSPFGVNDFRMSQSYGYLDPRGEPWKAGATETMHPFMDAETALAVKRANEAGVGGRSDWTGAQAQEIPWVLGKAEDLYGRGKASRYSAKETGSTVQGMVEALREANKTLGDFLPKHTLSSTYEYVPGENVGHVGELRDAPFEARKAYGEQGRWDRPGPIREDLPYWDSPYGRPGPEVGAGNRDVLYRAAGMRQRPTLEGVGQYKDENNPQSIARVLMDFANPAKHPGLTTSNINPPTQRAIEAVEGMRGLIDAQEASAANLPVTLGSRTGKGSVLLERGTRPDVGELAKLTEALRGHAVEGVTPTDRGALVLGQQWETPENQASAMRALMKPETQAALAEAYPGAKPEKAAYEGLYLPEVTTPADKAGKGIATQAALERFAQAPESLARNVSESEEVRRTIADKIARDASYASARPDIQKTREFFRDKDWARVVDLMRKGMKPAAALATVGASLEGMAAEPEPQR